MFVFIKLTKSEKRVVSTILFLCVKTANLCYFIKIQVLLTKESNKKTGQNKIKEYNTLYLTKVEL